MAEAEAPAEEPKPAESAPQSATSKPQSPSKPKAKKAEERDETVRVATSKLDALMAQVGELLAARIGAEHRMGEVRGLFDSLLDIEESLPHAFDRVAWVLLVRAAVTLQR